MLTPENGLSPPWRAGSDQNNATIADKRVTESSSNSEQKVKPGLIALCNKGGHLFPLIANGKRPVGPWKEMGTDDPEKLDAYAQQYPGCNWGLDAGASGLIIVDVDIKPDRDGEQSLILLQLGNEELPPTFTVRTPSGGRHLYFRGAGATTAGKLGAGLDTRGIGGYVVAPGSVVGGVSYEIIDDRDPAPAPEWLLERLAYQPRTLDAGVPACEPDRLGNIERAIYYLRHEATVAIEGAGGDNNTYSTACRVRDLGCSTEKCLELMLEHYNPRCVPPWDAEELETKVRSAYKSAQRKLGNAAPQAVFSPVKIQAAIGDTASEIPSSSFAFLSLDAIMGAPRPTRWIIPGYLEAGTLAILFGDPATMKSFLAIDMGLCVVFKQPWHGHDIPNPGPVFYIAGEGFSGIGKRIKAWTVAHGVDHLAVPFFISNAPAQFLDAEHARTVSDAVAALQEKHGAPKLVVVDTLNRNFGDGDENSGQDMSAFVATMDALRARFGCAVLVVHHSGIADKSRSRGSSVLRAAADFEYKLTTNGNTRSLTSTKCKDHEPPADMVFRPETVSTGWFDKGTGAEITSCVLRLTTTPGDIPQASKLTGARRIAYDALMEACERVGGPCHIDEWRHEAYARGVSMGDSDAKRKAFKRASETLAAAQLIKSDGEDLWKPSWPRQPDKPDTPRTHPGHVRGHQAGRPGHMS